VNENAVPEEFMRALLSLRQADHLPHILLEEVPPPRRLAPFTAALAMRTTDEDEAGQPLSTGRMVILHDPVEQIGWNGTFRVVCQLRAQVDAEMIGDPMLSEGVWGWMLDCLETAGAGFHDITGTVTREMSEAFGGLELRGSSLFVDVRASWTPNSEYLGEHLSGWADVMRRTAGIVPARHLEGV